MPMPSAVMVLLPPSLAERGCPGRNEPEPPPAPLLLSRSTGAARLHGQEEQPLLPRALHVFPLIYFTNLGVSAACLVQLCVHFGMEVGKGLCQGSSREIQTEMCL